MNDINLARELIRIAELLKIGGPVGRIKDPLIAGELAQLTDKLCPRLYVDADISPAELLVIAQMFASEPAPKAQRSGECLTRNVLAAVFGFDEELRRQVDLLVEMDAKGMIQCDHKAFHYNRATREVTPECRPACIYAGIIKITDYTYANIVRDERLMHRNKITGFESNDEFLDIWAGIVDSINWDRYNNPLQGSFNFDLSLSYIDDIHQAFELIHRKLAATTVEIPFLTMIRDFELTREEQILIMYDVYHRMNDRAQTATELGSQCVFAPVDTPLALRRPLLGSRSKLVENGIYRYYSREITDEHREAFFTIAPLFYNHIVGVDSVMKSDQPIL